MLTFASRYVVAISVNGLSFRGGMIYTFWKYTHHSVNVQIGLDLVKFA